MRERVDFPFDFIQTNDAWITMPDGARLSATLRLPTVEEPLPAILEYIPYRKDDGTVVRDNRQHDYLAGNGFASVRVDIRGSGNSDGVLYGEYLEQELDDAVDVIAWIAAQPWCNGKVAMMGISWGGFNCLQVAAKQPPALAAVLSVASTADRYATDVHYKGGCVLASDMLPWSATMLCFNARPPTPAIAGSGWRDLWFDRMKQTPVGVHDWLEHQHRDDFWTHGSVCQDYSLIECPVMILGGLADGYTDTVFHICAGVTAETAGVIGPWSHNYPAVGVPGPNIGFLQEAVHWFSRHLLIAGTDPKVVSLAPLRVHVQDWIQPSEYYPERPGRWLELESWPTVAVTQMTLWPFDSGLNSEAPPVQTVTGRNDLGSGARQGSWWGYAEEDQLPVDQQLEEPGAFRFLSEPRRENLVLVGAPELRVRLSVDQPVAQVAVRLCDIAPDGSSLQLSRGVLNLTHRSGHEHPEPMVAGEPADVHILLDAVAHTVPAGHQLELHVGTSLWPLVWPAPVDVVLSLHLGPSTTLVLPQLDSERTKPAVFDDPETAPSRTSVTSPADHQRTIAEHDGAIVVRDHGDHGTIQIDDTGTLMSSTATDVWSISRGDPLSALTTCERTWKVNWPGKQVEIVTSSKMWCDADHFYSSDTLKGFEDGAQVYTSTRDKSYPRDLV